MPRTEFDSYRDEILRVGKIVATELIERSDEPGFDRERAPYDAQDRPRSEPEAMVESRN